MSADLWQWEQTGWVKGAVVAGVDEVGRGPLAGPVVAAAVILIPDRPIPGLGDSKELSPRQREQVFPLILEAAQSIGVGAVGPRTIEAINILEASRLAMRRALGHLSRRPDLLLTDAMKIGGPWQEVALLHGDARSASIAAASIVAKVVRDRYMKELALQYPAYGFEHHKGYPTRMHKAALMRFGPCPAHRRTFLHG